PPPPIPDEPPAIHFDMRLEAPIAIGLTGAWLLLDILQKDLETRPCRWCEPRTVDNAVRNALVWRNTAPAARASDVIAYGALPLTLVVFDALEVHGDPRAPRRQLIEDF